MMQKMKLEQILKNQTITTQFDFSGSCKDKDGNTQTFTIFNSAFFLSEIMHNYFNRVTFIQDPENALTELVSIFNNWKTTRGPMYAKIMYAYSFGYNPIENYSSIEQTESESSLKHGLSIEHTWNQDKVTTTHNQDKTTTTYTQLKDDTKNYRQGVNSSENVATTETENTRSGSVSDEHTGSTSNEHTGGYSDTHSGKDITGVIATVTKTGNIGVMTPGQMIDSDYNAFVLHEDLQQRAIKEFLDRYTFYSEEVDLW